MLSLKQNIYEIHGTLKQLFGEVVPAADIFYEILKNNECLSPARLPDAAEVGGHYARRDEASTKELGRTLVRIASGGDCLAYK